jgi:hypothetical protein
MGAHLAAGRVRRPGGERTAEELDDRHAAGEQQRLVAIVQVKEIVRPEIVGDQRRRFMSRAGDVEVGESLLDEGLFDPIHFPGKEHRPVKPQQRRYVGRHQHFRLTLNLAANKNQNSLVAWVAGGADLLRLCQRCNVRHILPQYSRVTSAV